MSMTALGEASREESGAWEQTVALLVDAYRDLSSRKLFWLTLGMSALVSGAFMAVGINERGFSVFGYEVPSLFNTALIPRGTFFKYIFVQYAIPFWLGFLATILALIAVAGIVPDMIGGGSIDLYLSRPITRLRLFLTKYAFGLLFTACQVLVFSTVSFLVIGIRGGAWEPRIFLAVPLVTLFFSYLYCVCVLVGILTRSALAAMLLTTLFWGALYISHVTDGFLTQFAAAAEYRLEQQQSGIEWVEQLIAENEALPPDRRSNMSAFIFQRDSQRQMIETYAQDAADYRFWQRFVYGLKAPLPKTNETVNLMARTLVGPDPILAIQQQQFERRQAWRERRGGPATRNADRLDRVADEPEVAARFYEDFLSRDVSWVIGSSVLFECVVLGLAAWIFCRRDY